ncbi:hypothetical protein HYU07_03525 [Candidatus Woesearchaeota archaeon]|nr:hypothetical protein [Candidatus Woesearchaeota archaeon]
MDWNKFAWLNRGGRRKKILSLLQNSNRPLTIKEIKNNAQIAISQASVTISELYQQGLISCKNPNDKIGKLYEINKMGKELLNILEQNKND